MAPRELRAVHPLGKCTLYLELQSWLTEQLLTAQLFFSAPVITAGSITVAESGAIVGESSVTPDP